MMPRKAAKLATVGYDGRFELGIKSVQDPFETDKELTVAVNIRHDIVEQLFARHQIGEHQRRAGSRFLHLVQLSGAYGGLTVDPTKTPVDGRGDITGVLDQRLKAGLELNRILENIGICDYRIARYMIARDPEDFEGPRTPWERRVLGKAFREILTRLAILFGYMDKPRVAVDNDSKSPYGR